MQSVTRFLARVLPKRPTQLRTITSFQKSAIISSRCVCSCKSFNNNQTNVHNTSFSRYISTSGSADEEDNTYREEDPLTHIEVGNITFGTTIEQMKEFFKNLELTEEPNFIFTNRGFQTGIMVLQVNNIEAAAELNEQELNGRNIRVTAITKKRADAMIGKSVLKVSNLPYDWSTSDIYEFLYTQGVPKIMTLVVPPSIVYGSHCSGRAYLAFYSQEEKEIAASALAGVVAGRRSLRVENSNLVEGYLDRSRQRKKVNQDMGEIN